MTWPLGLSLGFAVLGDIAASAVLVATASSLGGLGGHGRQSPRSRWPRSAVSAVLVATVGSLGGLGGHGRQSRQGRQPLSPVL